jgi:hypothetical protein
MIGLIYIDKVIIIIINWVIIIIINFYVCMYMYCPFSPQMA